jgi:hypothetical protein
MNDCGTWHQRKLQYATCNWKGRFCSHAQSKATLVSHVLATYRMLCKLRRWRRKYWVRPSFLDSFTERCLQTLTVSYKMSKLLFCRMNKTTFNHFFAIVITCDVNTRQIFSQLPNRTFLSSLLQKKKNWQDASELQATLHCYLLQCTADGSNVESLWYERPPLRMRYF